MRSIFAAQAMRGMADPKRNREAIGLLEQALALDPRLAQAKAALAYRVFFRAYLEDRKYADEAIRLAQDAAAIDSTLAAPHFVLGSTYGLLGTARAVAACVPARVGARPESHREHA